MTKAHDIAKARHKKKPWYRIFRTINYRCNSESSQDYYRYGGRGIKNLLSVEDIKKLWYRDNGFDLKNPTIDRIDNDGNYTFNNCQFIENEDNVKRAHSKPVYQLDLDNNIIKKWSSQSEASRQLNISQGNIGSCCRDERTKAGNFKWRNIK